MRCGVIFYIFLGSGHSCFWWYAAFTGHLLNKTLLPVQNSIGPLAPSNYLASDHHIEKNQDVAEFFKHPDTRICSMTNLHLRPFTFKNDTVVMYRLLQPFPVPIKRFDSSEMRIGILASFTSEEMYRVTYELATMWNEKIMRCQPDMLTIPERPRRTPFRARAT